MLDELIAPFYNSLEEYESVKRGDIALFQGRGLVFGLLSKLLSTLDPYWRKLKWKPWHMAIIWEPAYKGWYILEATGQGVEINYYNNEALEAKGVRVYRWLDKAPSKKKMNEFLVEHIDKKYDVVIYFWTSFQYLVRHFLNRPIPRLLDDRFTCWELAFEFCSEMGKPIGSKYDCPMITDFLKAMEE